MLALLFRVGDDRFAIDTDRVARVLPLVYWKHVPDPPPGIVGLLNYQQTPVPVLDLSLLLLGRPAPERMHTRIILVHTHVVASRPVHTETPDGVGASTLLGLLAERVVGTLRYDPTQFVPPDSLVKTAPYLGDVLTDAHGIVQRIEVDALLSPDAEEACLIHAAETS